MQFKMQSFATCHHIHTMAFLVNTAKLGCVSFYRQKRAKKCRCRDQTKVGYWASFNHLQDYKIYGMVIKMFTPKVLNKLRQPPRDNPWLAHPMNKKFRIQFQQQCDYLFRFQMLKKINESILLKNWLRNESNEDDDAQEIPKLVYNQKMDQLMP